MMGFDSRCMQFFFPRRHDTCFSADPRSTNRPLRIANEIKVSRAKMVVNLSTGATIPLEVSNMPLKKGQKTQKVWPCGQNGR